MATYEGIGRPDVEAVLRASCETPAYYDFYAQINAKYKYYEFSDELSDEQRLDEYASVYQQFRKFVGSKTGAVLGRQEHLESLVAWVDDQMAKSDVYPRSRADLVYNRLKVDWLRQLRNYVTTLIDEVNGG